MPLQDGAFYVFPDGRKFRANLEASRAWTFVPPELEQITPKAWRESISKLLFLLANGKIISVNLYTPSIEVDTGWTIADLRREK